MNALHYGKKQFIETKMSSWSDDTYERVPFSCEESLSDREVWDRISSAIHKKFPPHHWAGMGYSCSVHEFNRETPTSGNVVLCHYQGIGD